MELMIQWAFTSSVLILIVLAVRGLFRDRLSARLRYALWGVVLLRLLIPFQVELPAGISDALPALASNAVPELPSALDRPISPDTAATFTQIPAEYLEDKQPNGEPVFSFTAADLQVYDPENDCLLVYRNGFTLGDMVVTLWLAGAGLTGAAVLLSNLRFSLRLRKRRRPLEVPDAPIPVYTAEGLPSPCLFGVFRPAVYVTPEAAEKPEALRHVLAHELTHYAHFDHLWSFLRILALALHWYNPLVWLAVILSKRDGELACDEGAVARLGEAERIPYGRTLVDMVAARSLRPADLLSCSTAMTGGEKSIKRRVVQIVKKPETVKAALFAAVAVVALAAVFVFAGRGEAKNETLQDYLNRTTAISYGPPLYSSTIYPEPITDEDLLAAAKEVLSSFRPLEDGDPQPDLSPEKLLHESRIVLTLEGGEMDYSLLWQNDHTYLFPGSIWKQSMDLREEEGETAQLLGVSGTCVSEVNAVSTLESLARVQWYQEREDLTQADYDYNRYRAQLEAAQGIWRNSAMLHNGRVITDSVQLERARELLVLEPLTEKEASRTWDGVWNATISFTSTPPDADWTGSGDCFYYISFEDGGIYVVSPSTGYMSTITGSYVGRIPEDHWNAVDELFENAPTVDDRQHAQRTLLGDLTQEQVDRANEAFRFDVELPDGSRGLNEISCFFTSSYDDPTQIDLEEFLRYCPLGEVLEDDEVEEFRVVMAEDKTWTGDYSSRFPSDFMVPVHRYPREEVSALLQKYAGVTVEELDWSDCLYVEEYDAFYNFTSDAGPGVFPCAGGQIMEDTVLLWSEPNEDGDRCELTLRKSGESWLIQSHHTIYER